MAIKLVLTNAMLELEEVSVKAIEEAIASDGPTFEVFIPGEGKSWKRITVFKSHVVMYYRYDSPRAALPEQGRKANVKG